jgi:intracellular sulfur oxidation DsrE/DsrF family protein
LAFADARNETEPSEEIDDEVHSHADVRDPRLGGDLRIGCSGGGSDDRHTAARLLHFSKKMVYQNDGGGTDDRTYFDRLLRNIGAHIAATDGKVQIRVVNFAAGVKPLEMAKTDPALAASLDGLRGKGVRFLVCRNTLRAMNLRPEDLYGVHDADVVPSGVAEIARLQWLGFVHERP